MKKIYAVIIGSLMLVSCGESAKNFTPKLNPIKENLRFCESTLWLNDSIMLIANFGSKELDPLNNEKCGYIVQCNDTLTSVLIPADGNLSAPKGMAVKDGYLFIADVNKMVVYNLNELSATPLILGFPAEDLYVNDIAISDTTLYVSVTNSGNIYKMNVLNPATLDSTMLVPFTKIVGANGIVLANDTLYVASYPADGTTTSDNVIYSVNTHGTPVVSRLIERRGQYDGLALSGGGKYLFFTDWTVPEVGRVNLVTKDIDFVTIHQPLSGPADMTIKDSVLYIPDLPNSSVLRVKL